MPSLDDRARLQKCDGRCLHVCWILWKTTKHHTRSHLDRCLHANRDMWLEHLGPKVAHDSQLLNHGVMWSSHDIQSRCLITHNRSSNFTPASLCSRFCRSWCKDQTTRNQRGSHSSNLQSGSGCWPRAESKHYISCCSLTTEKNGKPLRPTYQMTHPLPHLHHINQTAKKYAQPMPMQEKDHQKLVHHNHKDQSTTKACSCFFGFHMFPSVPAR